MFDVHFFWISTINTVILRGRLHQQIDSLLQTTVLIPLSPEKTPLVVVISEIFTISWYKHNIIT